MTALILPQNCVDLAMINPLAGTDHGVATWFHAHLTRASVSVLRGFTEFGSSEWIGVVLFSLVLFFVWKRWWPSLVTLIVAVPGGMLLNELVKVLVHRHRPFVDGPFVDWSGYSFASGHTIGATLLYGQLALFSVVDRPGRIQPNRFGCALFDRRSCRDLFRNNLAGILLDCRQANATKCGPGY